MNWTNPFEMPGEWFKGNLHTHTTRSDGRADPDERIAEYRDAGYDFLALTDHWVVSQDAAKSTADFLIIDGVECNVGGPNDSEMYHIVGLNVPPDVPLQEPMTTEAIKAALLGSGALVELAHPYWSGNTASYMIETLKGMFALEVFNATTVDVNKGAAGVHWDNVLDQGARVFGLAVDDSHRPGYDALKAWVMVKAPSLDLASVIEALKTGAFYSTTGPVIEDVAIQDGHVRVRCSPATSVSFMGQRYYGRRYAAAPGETMCEAEYPLRGEERYLRIEVAGATGGMAWTNPIYF